jgi:hypothetical protein
MVRTTTEADDATESEPKTFFDKVVDLEEGDTFELMGESLVVGHVRLSAASKTVSVWGRHEEQTQAPRYDLFADAKHDDVDVRTTRRTDSHDD